MGNRNNNDVVMIELDRPRQVKFTHTALKTLVEMSGKSLEELDEAASPTNFEFMEKMAYTGLLYDANKHGETLTVEKVPLLLDEAPSFSHVLEKLFAAWRIAFGAAPTPEGNLKPPEN